MKNKLLLVLFAATGPYGLPQVDVSGRKGGDEIQIILQIVFAIAGALALLFIVISGFKFITSAGNPQEVAKAKNGILYAVAGLAACILAEALVTFVVGHI